MTASLNANDVFQVGTRNYFSSEKRLAKFPMENTEKERIFGGGIIKGKNLRMVTSSIYLFIV
jgi:hypothetical protein